MERESGLVLAHCIPASHRCQLRKPDKGTSDLAGNIRQSPAGCTEAPAQPGTSPGHPRATTPSPSSVPPPAGVPGDSFAQESGC